ncbi:amidohydrolase [Streptomyces sp. NPDC101249]|uniref:amidohydrolase n=1 Tax=Streptomyces sp. NPDC101249 TaxID=3366140 RepID=UPI0037FC6F6F
MTALGPVPPAPSGPARVRIFTGPRILAGDGTEPEALAARSGRIIGTGTRGELRERHPRAEETELDGALLVLGFNDAHCHPSQAALARTRVDLDAVEDPAALRETLRRRARQAPPGTWVVAQPHDEHRLGPLDRDLLDQVSETQPIVVIHYSLHRAVVNSAGLRLLRYRTPRDAPSGGRLGTRPDGTLDGHLVERAWLDPWLPGSGKVSIAQPGSPERQRAALAEVVAELHAKGITSFCDALVTPVEQKLYADALAAGELTARVGMLLWHAYADPARLPPPSPAPHRLRTVGVKMMLDGALTGGTCRCRDPYNSTTGTGNGLEVLSPGELGDLVGRFHRAGTRVAVHANGDEAVQTLLEVIESLPPGTLRHRIEHCSIVDDRLIERIAATRTVAVPFGPFIALHGDRLVDYYGERAEMISAHRSLRDADVTVAGSSDYPLAPADPLLAIRSLVTRTTGTGRTVGPRQRVGFRDALDIYTHGSAAASGEAGTKGTLTVGRLADFAVLDTDLGATPPEEWAEARVKSTWSGGRCVYSDRRRP